MAKDDDKFEIAKRAVIQAGAGRGFIVSAGDYHRYVITAAHCLPHYPEPHLANGATELSYENILGALAARERTVWAELVEFNAASDFAVLGEPDGQVLWDEYHQYQAFTGSMLAAENQRAVRAAITIGQSPPAYPPYEWTVENETPAWLLSPDGEWQRCTVQNNGRFLVVRQGSQLIKSGMSGSPIVNDNGAAIGSVSTSGGDDFNMNPSLTDCLPQWLLRELDVLAE
jgi:S1-C subfamily serine protease